MPIDWSSGRKSIPERYRVELPREALRRLLVRELGERGADELLAELREAEGHYHRAVKVEQIRRSGTRARPDGSRELIRHGTHPRQVTADARRQLILDHAEAFIKGEWVPPHPASKELAE